MAAIPHFAATKSSGIATSTTSYFNIGMSGLTSDTEANVQTVWQTAGIFSSLAISVVSNGITASSTLVFRNNAANGNQTITIPASTSGIFIDNTHTDTVTAGNKYNVRLITGGTGTTIVVNAVEHLFAASANSTTRYVSTGTRSYVLAGNRYSGWGSTIIGVTSESSTQFKSVAAGTMNNFAVNVTANTWTGSTVVQSRIGGANGNLIVTIPASTTGIFQDTSDTDTIAVGNLINYVVTPATGSGSISLSGIAADLTTTNNTSQLISCTSGKTITEGTSSFFYPAGLINDTTSTETSFQLQALTAMTLSKAQINPSANTVTASSAFTSRKNGSAGNQTATIPASSTGWYTDTTNSDSLVSTDLFDFELVAGSSGTSLSLVGLGALMTINSSNHNLLPLLGVG